MHMRSGPVEELLGGLSIKDGVNRVLTAMRDNA